MTVTLTDFLLARIAEDYDHAVRLARIGEQVRSARVLADCEAKRRIVELHSDKVEGSNFDAAEDCRHAACPTLRALASVYADHPDCRDEWRP